MSYSGVYLFFPIMQNNIASISAPRWNVCNWWRLQRQTYYVELSYNHYSCGKELSTVLERRNYEAISSGKLTYWLTDSRKILHVINFFICNKIYRQ